jgi:signal transduction histidine kinase
MDLIRRGAQAAAKLTNKLALFSGLGRTTDDMQVDNLEELIGALALMAQERVGSRVTVSHSVVSGLPKVGIGVAPLIEVTNHILANAIEAIPDSGTIVIAAARDASGRNVEISIRDTGVGMSAETVSRAFEPFFTTKNLDERNSIGIGGQGLGLWNVYNLLRACDGDIAVQSALGQGTTVTIKIPLVEEAGLRV